MIGWNLKATHIIMELDELVAKNTNLIVATKFLPEEEDLINLRKNLKNIEIAFLEGDTTDRKFLESLTIVQSNFKRVLILGYSEEFEQSQADSQTLITLLHIRDIIEKEKNLLKKEKSEEPEEIQIVTEILDSRNQDLANRATPDDFIVSSRFVAMILAQLSYQKNFRIFNLFSSDRQQIFLKLASNYVPLNETINFATIVEAASRKGEAAIGYQIKNEGHYPQKNYGCYLNPDKSENINFKKYDRIIVFSDSETK